MRLTFRRIEIHNFLSFSDEVFEFDTARKQGLTLICGKNNDIPGSKNAAGKTSLNEALCFALFGQTRNNLKNGNIANKYSGSKEVRVVISLSVDDNQYKIASGFNKYGAPYCKIVEVKDGEEVDITKSTIMETRKFIEAEILHCDLPIFLRTVILSSDQEYNFYKLSKYEKKLFIEKLFDIQIFGKIYNNIHRDVLNLDKSIISHQNRLVVLNKSDAEYKDRIAQYEQNKTESIKQLNVKKQILVEKQEGIRSKNIKSNEEEVSKYEDAANKLNTKMQDLQDKIRKANKDMSKLELQLHKITSSKDQKQKAIDKHAELLGKLCNDCKKIFSDYYSITTYEDEIKQLEEKAPSVRKSQQETQSYIDEYSSKQNLAQSMIDKVHAKIKELTEEYNKAQKALIMLESQISSVESDIVKTEKQKNPYDDLYQSNLVSIKNESTVLDEETEKYKYLKFAENIVSQDTLRKFIISDLIWLLNNKIKTYLTKFGARYSVEFDANMDYKFITEAGQYEYANFSAGERARLMIATCFAFRDFMYIRNNFSSNILFLDEFIDGAIDDLAIESILGIMKEFCQTWKQNIYIISHRKEINNDVFDNIIQVVKTNNISKITYLE